MDPSLLPLYLGAVVLIIALIGYIPRDWRAATGGLMLILLGADSVIAALRALLR